MFPPQGVLWLYKLSAEIVESYKPSTLPVHAEVQPGLPKNTKASACRSQTAASVACGYYSCCLWSLSGLAPALWLIFRLFIPVSVNNCFAYGFKYFFHLQAILPLSYCNSPYINKTHKYNTRVASTQLSVLNKIPVMIYLNLFL